MSTKTLGTRVCLIRYTKIQWFTITFYHWNLLCFGKTCWKVVSQHSQLSYYILLRYPMYIPLYSQNAYPMKKTIPESDPPQFPWILILAYPACVSSAWSGVATLPVPMAQTGLVWRGPGTLAGEWLNRWEIMDVHPSQIWLINIFFIL